MLKAYVLSLMMLAGMLLPVSAFAQSDDFFRDIGDYSNRATGTGAYSFNNQQFGGDSNGGYNFDNQTFGQNTVPLGSGMLVLTVIGAGYIAVRRSLLTNKKSRKMKKLSTLIITIALVLGLTQCKKNVETITTPTGSVGEPVYISFNVGSGDKHIVYPGTGAVVYTEGDKLYVGNNGKYIGTLEYHNGTFGGTIYGPSTDDYLHVYFVGGLTPSATPSAGSTTSFTVNISDQSSQLPVLSYGHSTQKYTDGTATYGCTSLNQCGLVKFVPSQETFNAITVSGMKTTATIDFSKSTPGITPTEATGTVKLYSANGTQKWAILLPQDEVNNPTVTCNANGCYLTITNVPAVTANMYYSTGVAISIETPPTGALNGKFTVNSNGDQVWFSNGNLQYIGSASPAYWKFAENQWDYLGTTTGQNSSSSTVDRDLFCWATSGYNHNYNNRYEPWSTYQPNDESDDDCYDAYDIPTANLYDGNGTADWGYNAIYNGGNTEGQWRTPTKNEWDYVFFSRTTSSNIRFARAKVHSIQGFVLLPDDWNSSTYSFTNPNVPGDGSGIQDYQTIADDEWELIEDAGAVFLPQAGYRNGTLYQLNGSGNYWSSSKSSVSDTRAVAITLTLQRAYISNIRLASGRSVRLVQNVE